MNRITIEKLRERLAVFKVERQELVSEQRAAQDAIRQVDRARQRGLITSAEAARQLAAPRGNCPC
jgi:hypothetical protein